MMENVTINIWMILAVILSVGMIAILVFSIYRGINRCHHRIDNQDDSLEKIDGRLNNINNEIINIKIDQANVKAIQTIKGEDSKNQSAAPPINIYQQAPPQQSPYPTVQSSPQPAGFSYAQQYPPQMQYWPQQQESIQQQQRAPSQQQQAPVQQGHRQAQQQVPTEVQYFPPPAPQQEPEKQYRGPELVKPQRTETVKEQLRQPIQEKPLKAVQEEVRRVQQIPQESEVAQQNSQDYEAVKAPVYHKTRMPDIGFTEFQLPEEYDFEEEDFSEQAPDPVFEEKPQVRPEQRPKIRPESRPQARHEPRPQIKPEPRHQVISPNIPPREKVIPSKFNSLNDGISRRGKRYSEEEIANRILD